MLTLLLVLAGRTATCQDKAPESARCRGRSYIKVATLIPPMTEVLDLVKPMLKEEGINLEIQILSDNVRTMRWPIKR